jgi:hypothetical protein
MGDPLVTGVCATAKPHADTIPRETDKPLRISRRKNAADSMAMRTLQNISIKTLASGIAADSHLLPP